MERRWLVQCDEAACDGLLVVPPPDDGGNDDKWGAGVFAADSGWDVAPNRRETFCPRHAALTERSQ